MEILTFKLQGRTAFFRDNEYNKSDMFYTFGHIHKVALLGLLGAIVGLGGNITACYKTNNNYVHPEFYTRLKDMEVAIVPNARRGCFSRKQQENINTCGYSKEGEGLNRNLIYKQQWIYNPSWDIYINLDTVDKEIAEKLKDYIFNNKAVFMPYLGQTSHPAVISNPKLLEGEKNKDKSVVISGMFKADSDNITADNSIDMFNSLDAVNNYEYREMLPCGYSENNCFYNKCMFIVSNKKFIINSSKVNIIKADSKNLYMF